MKLNNIIREDITKILIDSYELGTMSYNELMQLIQDYKFTKKELISFGFEFVGEPFKHTLSKDELMRLIANNVIKHIKP